MDLKNQLRVLQAEQTIKEAEAAPEPVTKPKDKHRGAWFPNPGMDWNPLARWPRNEPCYCGSGAKAKKCCLPYCGPTMKREDCAQIAAMMANGPAGLQAIRVGFIKQLAKMREAKATPAEPQP